jgi:carbon dioxide concentrating mechanism protein CcmN
MIYLPPPQPLLNKDIRLSGDVEIHPTASLAPGVILQAAPNGKIVIGADVCIGMGVIINACQGYIEIESGAILGSGVLIVGDSKIGHNSCIGTSSTIYQANVTSMSVIEPGSLIGDFSRKVVVEQAPSNSKQDTQPQTKADKNTSKAKRVSQNNYYFKEKSEQIPTQNNHKNNATASVPSIENPVTSVEATIPKPTVPVVGQLYINELLVTLFPHRKPSDYNSPS